MYAFVTTNKVEFFDKHLDAFTEYNNSKLKIRGVFDIRGNRLEIVNSSLKWHDIENYFILTTKLKEELRKEQDEEY